jgi:flagellar motor switch protein FliM
MDAMLSQEEVDLLLKGVTNEPDEIPDQKNEFPDGVRPYNLATQERIVRGRMPTLEMINDRFNRLLKQEMFALLRRNVEISRQMLTITKYGDFIRSLVVPSNFNLIFVNPLVGQALIVLDPSLVFMCVDTLFGGDGRFTMRIEGRDFTETEQRIIQRIIDIIFDCYTKCWEPVYPVEFVYQRSEMHTQFVNIATPNEPVITASFMLDAGEAGGGKMHICFPYTMLEPLREILTSSMQGESISGSNRWMHQLSHEIQAAELEMVVDLGSVRLRMDDIVKMKLGDIIPFEVPETVIAKINGVPVSECSFGTMNGHRALRIKNMLSINDTEATHAIVKEAQYGG